jgi:hypothetical protein
MASLFDPFLITGKNGRPRLRPMDDDEKRMMFRVLASAATLDECQQWPGFVNPSGYGMLQFDGRHQNAHHVALELHLGEPIPPDHVAAHWLADYDLDSCSRSCVNVIHLEVMTGVANTLAGGGLTAVQGRQTHCLRGHPLTGPNLRVDPDGRRRCRTCAQALGRARTVSRREWREAYDAAATDYAIARSQALDPTGPWRFARPLTRT